VSPTRIAVLASGSGTLLDAIIADEISLVVVVADRPCRALDVARSHGVVAELLERTDWSRSFDRDAYTERLVKLLQSYGVDVVVMAGFGTVVPRIVDAFPGRVLNSHPALLPSFKGWHAVRAALDYGVKVTGTTIHVVTAEMDEGPILAQQAVTVLPDDDEASLHERIKEVERELYPRTIRRYVEQLARSAPADQTAPTSGPAVPSDEPAVPSDQVEETK
jgi:phosphoribosylglycinamide formyltransferase 1